MLSPLQVEVDANTLESSEFKEQWVQYTKDMISTCQAGNTEMMVCATECQLRLAVYELPTNSEGRAKLVLKHVPHGADHMPWVHVLSVVSSLSGTTYFLTDIPPNFEPMYPEDWGEFY